MSSRGGPEVLLSRERLFFISDRLINQKRLHHEITWIDKPFFFFFFHHKLFGIENKKKKKKKGKGKQQTAEISPASQKQGRSIAKVAIIDIFVSGSSLSYYYG